MLNRKLSLISFVAAAGCACSIGMAQVRAGASVKKATPVAGTDGQVGALKASGPLKVAPIHWVEGKGWVKNGTGSGTDHAAPNEIFNSTNFDVTTITAIPGTSVAPYLYQVGGIQADVVDSVYFNRGPGAGAGPLAGGPQTLTSVTMLLIPTAGVGTTFTPDLEFKWFNGFNNTTTPVGTGSAPATTKRLTVAAPTAGWGAFVYFVTYDLTVGTTAPGITTTSDFGAVEVSIYDNTTNTCAVGGLSVNFTPGWQGSYPTIGDSLDSAFLDLGTVDCVFGSAEAFTIITGWPTTSANPLANLGIELVSTQASSGACCLPDGSCIVASAIACTRASGTYTDNTLCTAVVCNQPGACSYLAGGCVLMSQAQCVALTTTVAVYQGNGTNCADHQCRTGTGTITLWDNGPIDTGHTNSNAVAAPAGINWSELINTGAGGCANSVIGFQGGAPNHIADDFTVPTGETWTIKEMNFWAYAPGYASGTVNDPTNPINFNVQIFNSIAAGDNFLFNFDATTPVYDSLISDPSGGNGGTGTIDTYANLFLVAGGASGQTRALWKLRFIPTNGNTAGSFITLGPGHYYVSWQSGLAATPTAAASNPEPTVKTKGVRGAYKSFIRNSMTRGTGSFKYNVDNPVNYAVGGGTLATGCAEGNVLAEMPFKLLGTVVGAHDPFCIPPVAPNCLAACKHVFQGQTTGLCLSVLDFGCFTNAFAAANLLLPYQQQYHYANIDHSTTFPYLNVGDFARFGNLFTTGCATCP